MTDKQFELLASISSKLKKLHKSNGPSWQKTPFEWIKQEPSSSRRGKIGADMVEEWSKSKSMSVKPPLNSDSDRTINGFRVEIKFSTLWATGHYRFQQIRDQEYDYMFCLGISPNTVHAWFIPKSALDQHVIGKTGQHGGKGAKETALIHFEVDQVPAWMQKYGGSLSSVEKLIKKAGKGPY